MIGAAAVLTWRPIVPDALAFAAGAMIYVVIEEVIPEAQQSGHADAATVSSMLGLAAMMILEVAFRRSGGASRPASADRGRWQKGTP